MSIVSLPPELSLNCINACAICQVKISLNKATAGPYDANDRQAFACVSHLSEVELLIVGWADFLARERISYQKGKAESTAAALYGDVSHARSNS